jgi:hypothetical protein
MPLTPEMTLAQARNSVAIRAGVATSGSLPNTIRDTIDEALRAAQKLLYTRNPYTRRRQTIDAALTTDVSAYDLPNGVDIGDLGTVLVVTPLGKVYEVVYEDSPRLANLSPTAGRPRWFRVINQEIVLYPAPDAAEYPTLRFECQASDGALVDDADRLAVDSEAAIRLATINVKKFLGVAGDSADRTSELRELDTYLDGVRGRVNPTRAYGIASNDAGLPLAQHLGDGQPYVPSWNPW